MVTFSSDCITMHHHYSTGVSQMPARKASPTSTAARLTVTLKSAHREELNRIAAETDRSLAWLVRDALRQYLDRARGTKQGPAN
jgi:Ribbon-helix-helix protein, copG family